MPKRHSILPPSAVYATNARDMIQAGPEGDRLKSPDLRGELDVSRMDEDEIGSRDPRFRSLFKVITVDELRKMY